MVFVIHWHESAMDLHVFPILIPPSTSLSIRFLWVFPVHQAQAFVSCIQPGLVICFTLDNKGTFHAKMSSIKDRNGMDLTEAEDIKKRLSFEGIFGGCFGLMSVERHLVTNYSFHNSWASVLPLHGLGKANMVHLNIKLYIFNCIWSTKIEISYLQTSFL